MMEHLNMNMNLIFMLLAVESDFLYYGYFIELIDNYLTDLFFDHPILMELSLSDSRNKFIEIINYSKIDKSEVNFNHLLLGFIIIAFNKNIISPMNYKKKILDIFETQHMIFSIEEIHLFFEKDETVYIKVNTLFLECEQKARDFIYIFEENMTNITSNHIKLI